MNVAIYSRKSVYSDKSDSVEAQVLQCKEYASRLDVTTITDYIDEGYTGANTNRPDFTRLMRDIAAKRIDVLICYKIDRISRNVLDFSKTFEVLQKNSVEFVSVKEQIDTTTPLGRAMMYICSVFAQMERETTAERVKDGMLMLAKSGNWTGGKAPMGYSLKKSKSGSKTHTILTVNEAEMPFLNLVYSKFLEGNTLSGLETYFRNTNTRSLKGSYISTSQIHQILKNPQGVENTPEIYDYFKGLGCTMAQDRELYDGKHGLIVYGRTSGGKKKLHAVKKPSDWTVCIGKHKPITDAARWLSVQARFNINKFAKTKKHNYGALAGILRCSCGRLMQHKHKADKQYDVVYNHYFCPNKDKSKCNMGFVRRDRIDTPVIEILKTISQDKAILAGYIKSENTNSIFRSEADVKRDMTKIEKSIQALTLTLRDNIGSSASKYIIKDMEALDLELNLLKIELREISIAESELDSSDAKIDLIYEEIKTFVSHFDDLNYEAKSLYLKEILVECVWDGENLHIKF